jgi:hypothetical protein
MEKNCPPQKKNKVGWTMTAIAHGNWIALGIAFQNWSERRCVAAEEALVLLRKRPVVAERIAEFCR